jgi:hypothetical protein
VPAPLVTNLTHCGVGVDGRGGLASRADGFESDALLGCRSQSRPSYAHGRTRLHLAACAKDSCVFQKELQGPVVGHPAARGAGGN